METEVFAGICIRCGSGTRKPIRWALCSMAITSLGSRSAEPNSCVPRHPYRRDRETGVLLPVVDLACAYVSPARYDDLRAHMHRDRQAFAGADVVSFRG